MEGYPFCIEKTLLFSIISINSIALVMLHCMCKDPVNFSSVGDCYILVAYNCQAKKPRNAFNSLQCSSLFSLNIL